LLAISILWETGWRNATRKLSEFTRMANFEKQSQVPRFFELLPAVDQERYVTLWSALSSRDCWNNRNQRLGKFQEIVRAILEFRKHSHNPVNASLVCGVCPLTDGLAINIRQLRVLFGKCKSSINGSFLQMGWIGLQLKDRILDEFLAKMPSLRASFSELREWSVRSYQPSSPLVQKFSPRVSQPSKPADPTPPPSLGDLSAILPPSGPSENAWAEHEDAFCLAMSSFDF
jgi:hypothetical protein